MTSFGAWVAGLINNGTGLNIPARHPEDPLNDFEARQMSWDQGEPVVAALETAHECDLLPLHFALFRLTDLALIEYRMEWPLRTITPPLKESARQVFWRLHQERPGGALRSALPGPPKRAEVYVVLSGVAYYVYARTGRKHLSELVKLIDAVYPPLFLLSASKPRPDAEPAGRAPWRMLSENIAKARRDDGERDYRGLERMLDDTTPPDWTHIDHAS